MLRMKKVLLLVTVAMVVVMCAGTVAFADVSERGSDSGSGAGGLISREVINKVAEEMSAPKQARASQSVKFPNINKGDPVEIYDGWAINTDRDAVLVFLYNNNAPQVYDGDKAVAVRDSYKADTSSGTVYLNTYQIRKGSRYVVRKVSDSDRIVGCYATCNCKLKSGKAICVGSVDNDVTSYFKVKAKGNSLIQLDLKGYLSEDSTYKVQLFNSKKKAITKGWDELAIKNGSCYWTAFGVKKGTYYLGIRPVSNSSDSLFNIKATVSKKKLTPAGKTQKKAKAIKVGKKAKQLFYCGKNSHHWYKVKISKAGTYRLRGNVKIGWGGSDRTGQVSYRFGGCGRWDNGIIKCSKGTLYIHFYNVKTTNGYYEFKLEKA